MHEKCKLNKLILSYIHNKLKKKYCTFIIVKKKFFNVNVQNDSISMFFFLILYYLEIK